MVERVPARPVSVCGSEWLRGRRDSTPLCPAGHLPRKVPQGGDWTSHRPSPIANAVRLLTPPANTPPAPPHCCAPRHARRRAA
ncbi:MAG: hypothetical protein EOQ30_16705 [Mesorhizobium sp.]|nr:MAG: hypothetical protein EOQ30_16705 [Mesorhizobium sp.]